MFSERSTVWPSSHSRLPIALLWAVFLLFLASAQGSAAGIDDVVAQATTPVLEDLKPGQNVTISIVVQNKAGRPINLNEEIDLPKGWQTVIGGSPFTLAPGEETVRLVMFRVPLSTAVGSYTLAYIAARAGALDLNVSEEMVAVVAPHGRLDLIERHIPARTVAGEALVAELTAVNHGNAEVGVVVEATSSESYDVTVEPSHFVLGPGKSRDVTIVAGTPKDLTSPVGHVFLVEGRMPQLTGNEVIVASSLVQRVIPSVTGDRDRFHRVPSMFRAAYLSGEDGSGLQLEFSGEGRLTTDGTDEIEFAFRTPDSREKSRFGERDEYAVRLRGERYDILAGDGVYELTELTGRRYLGRGGTAALHRGGFHGSVSYFETRAERHRRERGMAAFGYDHGEILSVGLNYVKTPQGEGDILSFGLTSSPSPFVDVDVEYAAQADRMDSRASWARVRGTWGKARCLLEGLDADGDFRGRLSNEDYLTGTVDVPLFSDIRVNALYRDYENRDDVFLEETEDGTPILSSVTHDATRSLGLRGKLTRSIRASVDYRWVHRHGRSPSTDFEYRTEMTRLEVAWTRPAFTAMNSLEFGWLSDAAEDVEEDVLRYALGFTYRPTYDWRIHGRYESALSGSPDPANRNDTARFDAEFMPSEGFTWSTSVRWIGIASSILGRPDELSAGAGYTLPWDHTLSAEMRWMRPYSMSDYETDARIVYEIPFGTPIVPKGGSGSLRGMVSDAADPGHSGLPDVVLMLDGLTAVTDSRGRYEFPNVPPGDHQLTVDAASIGSERVPSAGLPRRVLVVDGEESVFDFGVTQPGRICGAVIMDGSADDMGEDWGIEGTGGPPALLVEARCDDQVRKQLTDPEGRFSFDRLRPGRWKVTIAKEGLPRLHTIDTNTFVINVRSGETDVIEVSVTPPSQTIPIIDTGDIRLSALAE